MLNAPFLVALAIVSSLFLRPDIAWAERNLVALDLVQLFDMRGSSVGGVNLCKALLQRSSGQKNTLSDVVPAIGVAEGNQGAGHAMRRELAHMLQDARKSGESESEVIRSLLVSHGHQNTEQLGGLAPPGKVSAAELRQIQEVVSKTNLEALVKAQGKKEKVPEGVIKAPQILDAIERIEKGYVLGAGDLSAIKTLHTRVLELDSRAAKLHDQAGDAGGAAKVTWDFLQAQDKEIRGKIAAAKSTEKVYISHPAYEGGKLVLNIKAFENFEDYRAFYELYRSKAKTVENYKKNLEQYSRDYLVYRYLANRFRNLDHDKVMFDKPGYRTQKEIDEATEAKQTYKSYRAEIPKTLNEMDSEGTGQTVHAIHPNVRSLRADSNYINMVERPKLAWQIGYAASVGTATTSLALLFLSRNAIFTARDIWAIPLSIWEARHGNDSEYWIEKCSDTVNNDDLVDCLKRFGASAQKMAFGKIAEKRKTNKDYNGEAENLELAALTDKVLRSILKPGRMPQIANENQIKFLVDYLGQEGYNQIKLSLLQIEEENKKQTVIGPAAPLSVQVRQKEQAPGNEGTVAANDKTVSGLSKKAWTSADLTVQVGKMGDDLTALGLKAKETLSVLKGDPKVRVDRSLGFHKELVRMQIKLEMLSETLPDEETTKKIDFLYTRIQQELNELQSQMTEGLVAGMAQLPTVAPPGSGVQGVVDLQSAADPGELPRSESPTIQVPPKDKSPLTVPSAMGN